MSEQNDMVLPNDDSPAVEGREDVPRWDLEAGAGQDHDPDGHDGEVVEDDLIAGGWTAWDVTPPRKLPRRDPLARFDHRRPDRMLARAAP
jgi:hypothetical protein